jgi:hypothetical protein
LDEGSRVFLEGILVRLLVGLGEGVIVGERFGRALVGRRVGCTITVGDVGAAVARVLVLGLGLYATSLLGQFQTFRWVHPAFKVSSLSKFCGNCAVFKPALFSKAQTSSISIGDTSFQFHIENAESVNSHHTPLDDTPFAALQILDFSPKAPTTFRLFLP